MNKDEQDALACIFVQREMVNSGNMTQLYKDRSNMTDVWLALNNQYIKIITETLIHEY